jgi:hypothetical protein
MRRRQRKDDIKAKERRQTETSRKGKKDVKNKKNLDILKLYNENNTTKLNYFVRRLDKYFYTGYVRNRDSSVV